MSWLVRPSQVCRWTRVVRAARQNVGIRPRKLLPPSAVAANLSQVWANNYTTKTQPINKIDPLLYKLDGDVRKFGRINKKDLDDVLEEFRIHTSITSSQSLLVIRCCGNLVPEELPEVRTKLVDEVWKTLIDRGVPVDISHYNALLRVYIENEHKFSSEKILKDLESKGVEPNRVTYQRLMWNYCQNGDVEGASEILEKMREKNLPLSEAVLDALVLGHVRQNNMEGAHSVLTAMSTAGIIPTSRTYSILMGGSARTGDIEAVKKILDDCESKEIFFSDRELMEVLEELAIGGHEQHVDFILEKMQKTAGYKQEAINLIMRLIYKKCEDVALKVVKSLTKPTNYNTESTPLHHLSFYIRHLIKVDAPIDIIIAHIKDLHINGYAPMAYKIAAQEALHKGNTNLAIEIFNLIELSGESIRQHYFWPLIVKNKNNSKEILRVLNTMIQQFKLMPVIETLRDYVIPSLNNKSYVKIIDSLRESGVSSGMSLKSVVMYLLAENKMKEAAEMATKYGTKTELRFMLGNLIDAFNKTRDVDSLVSLASVSCSANSKTSLVEDVKEEEGEVKEDYREAVGRLINGIVKTNINTVKEFLPDLLEKMLSNGLGITSAMATKIQENLGSKIDNQISDLLIKLTSEDLNLVEHDIDRLPPIRRSSYQLESLIQNYESKGENALNLKKQLFYQYVRTKDITNLKNLIDRLKAENFDLTTGMLCHLLDMYCQMDNLENAMSIYKDILAKEPEFGIDSFKVVRLIALLVKQGCYDEAIDIAKKQILNENKAVNEPFQHNSLIWQMFNNLAETGNVEKLDTLFNVLVENKYFEVTNIMLGPLIKVYLTKDDMEGALKKFEECCVKYHCTPWKNELNKKLILNEDANGLQRLTDLSTTIHGEVNSLYDLVFGFIECGKLKQARKILETPGMRLRNQRINMACERYNMEGKVECLEGLLEATRELSHIDRSEVFYQLLNSYIRNDSVEKALELWTLLQEENLPASDKFLISLANYLKIKNVSVPFVVPGGTVSKNTSSPKKNEITPVKVVKKASERLPAFKVFVQEMIDNKNFEKLTEEIINRLKYNQTPNSGTLKHILTNLSLNGQHEMIDKIGSYLNRDQKKMTAYENKRSFAKSVSGNSFQYLDELENEIDSAKDEDLSYIQEKFPSGGIFTMISPNSYDRIVNISEKYLKRGILNPYNVIWCYDIVNKNYEAAQNTWDKCLSNSKKILFWKIVNIAKENKDLELVDTLYGFLIQNKHVTKTTLGVVKSNKIDILVKLNKTEEAMSLLKDSLTEGFSLNNFNTSSLIGLKDAIDGSGGTFEYVIPNKRINNNEN